MPVYLVTTDNGVEREEHRIEAADEYEASSIARGQRRAHVVSVEEVVADLDLQGTGTPDPTETTVVPGDGGGPSGDDPQ